MLSLIGGMIVRGCNLRHILGVDPGRVVDQRCPVGGLPEFVRGDDDKLLRRIEQRAREIGLGSIFVLTTRAMHWFIKRDFRQVPPDWLPEARIRKYNWDRKSQVLVKQL